MKLTRIALISLASLAFASCGSRYNNPEELTIPVLQAVKSQDVDRLECLIPTEKEVNEAYASNPMQVGFVYFNKYSSDYNREYLVGRMRTNLDIIENISKNEDLDWDGVQYSAPQKKDVNDSGKSYTMVSTILKFPNDKQFDLSFNAVKANSKWFVFDDINLSKRK